MRRDRLWTPAEVERYARTIKESLDHLTEGRYSYREAHKHVWLDKRDSQTDENQGQKISSSGKTDPTGEAVISQEDNRKRLAHASKKLEHAAREIDAATALVKRVFSSPDDYYRPLESFRP